MVVVDDVGGTRAMDGVGGPSHYSGYCQVDEKLVDRPPRYWARASREPAMLGIRNGRQPQLDNTIWGHHAGRGRPAPPGRLLRCVRPEIGLRSNNPNYVNHASPPPERENHPDSKP